MTQTTKAPIKIFGMDWKIFMACSVILFIGYAMGLVSNNLINTLVLSIIAAELLFFVGDAIPGVNTYLGGGAIFCIMGPAILVFTGVISPEVVDGLKAFTLQWGFLDLCIIAVIVGSILGMNGKTLVSVGVKYFVAIFGCVLVSFLGTGLLGMILGYGFTEGILYIAAPIVGGGVGAGAIPLADIYANAYGLPSEEILATILPATVVGNPIAIILSCLAVPIGTKFPKLSGDGVLIEDLKVEPDEAEKNFKVEALTYGVGFLVAGSIFLLGNIIGEFVTFLHPYALTILLVIIFKLGKILPRDIEIAASHWANLSSKVLMKPLMFLVGVALIDFQAVIDTLSDPIYFILIIACVIFAAIGAGIFGMLVKFKFIESAITAGLCMANAGGTGDVCVLTAAKRLNLMPFAAISSRIGGAIILFLMSILAEIIPL